MLLDTTGCTIVWDYPRLFMKRDFSEGLTYKSGLWEACSIFRVVASGTALVTFQRATENTVNVWLQINI